VTKSLVPLDSTSTLSSCSIERTITLPAVRAARTAMFSMGCIIEYLFINNFLKEQFFQANIVLKNKRAKLYQIKIN
jgi:hypothetical protein